jgi:predicted MFS family arabinose efflux permease
MLGGLITVHLGWRWIFLVTVPVGVVAVIAALVFLDRDGPRPDLPGRLDVLGAVVLSAGLVTLLLGMEDLGRGGHTGRAVLVVCFGLVLLACLVLVERRASHPLITPRLVRSRRMVGGCLTFGAYCAGYTAVIVVGSLRLQEEHGLSAAGAGLALSPVLVSGIISSLLSPLLLRRHGTRLVLTTALLLCATALAMVAFSDSADAVALAPWLVLWGISSGPIYVALTRECVGDAAEADRGTASALLESMSHVGGGVAASAYLILLGAGAGFRFTELAGAAAVAVGVVIALVVLPRRDSSR